ncbi:MAG: DUF4330 family protein [Clostridia bacterium]|nr:DUF4330 family protein [Clostridia bacterium]
MEDMKKRAFKINFVDVIITLMIILVLSVAALMIASAFGATEAIDSEDVDIEYTVLIKGVLEDFRDTVQVGDAVIDSQERQSLGTVVGVEYYEYSYELYNDETHKMEIVTHPHSITIEMKVTATGYRKDGIYYLKESGKPIGVGTGFNINTPHYCGIGYVGSMSCTDAK